MANLIRFPLERTFAPPKAQFENPATVVILPVIRIERHVDDPDDRAGSSGRDTRGRKSRRRSS